MKKKLTIRRLTTALGAEVSGVDLSRPLSKSMFDEITNAFHEHLVLLFRDQKNVSAHALASIAERFGPPTLGYTIKPGREHHFVTDLIREADVPSSRPNVGGTWHSDQSMRERPSLGFILYCRESPEYGGDTLFTNLYSAYDSLSDGMKALCERLTVIHSAAGRFGHDGRGLRGLEAFGDNEEALRVIRMETEHPLVRIHPGSGKKLLFVNGVYTVRIAGMTDEESRPLLSYLNEHATRPEFTCRIHWQRDTLMLADNRATLHRALNDYPGFRRHMMRIEVEGERPYGPAMMARKKVA